ncbi:hypothetical protein ONZ45_g10292 [Pleurotus djamor]|nr:hypothetical protein ONZ45_g10292 [Pleurotus djamor]
MKMLNVMLGQSDRFKEFSITFLRTASLDALSKIKITNPPPLLETLTLKAPYDWNFILPCPLPSTAGSLTVLRLDNIFFKPEIPVLISLRKLIIAGSWTEEELSIDWVAHLLRKTPNIEEVRIWGISDESKDIIVQHDPIYLQSLKSLSIASQLLSAEDIFDIIRFPASTIVTALYMGYFDDSSLQQLRIQALLSSFTSCHDSISFEKMRIILVDDEITEPGWSFHLEFFSADAEKPEPFLSHGIPFDSDMPGAYLDICTRLPLSQITELVLSQFYPSQEWQELFFGLVNLVVLSLEDLGDSWLTHLLADATTVPQLKVVSFRFMKLRSSAEKHTQTMGPPALMNDTTSLGNDEDSSSTLQFIKRRREAGVPLQKLILQECNITHKQIERLRLYVDVEWDGIEQIEDIDSRCPGPFSCQQEVFGEVFKWLE